MQTFSPLEYIQIHIANMYGHDKWDYTDRILWTLVHDEELEDLTEEADDPYSYWVAVNEYRKVCNNKPTGLIVRFDATASGAQLLSVMTGCRKDVKLLMLLVSIVVILICVLEMLCRKN